jgi:hypothetical protein
MTIAFREVADEYFSALNGGPSTIQQQDIARIVDKGIEAMLEVFQEEGIKFPGDDRCANVEVMVYSLAKEANAQGEPS